MGCFLGQGAISNLPIKSSDRIGLIICKREAEKFTPAFPIIWGSYNDYGGIEAIDEGPLKKVLFNYIGDPAGGEDILNMIIYEIFWSRRCSSDIKPGIIYEFLNGCCGEEFIVFMEHEDVLERFIKLSEKEGYLDLSVLYDEQVQYIKTGSVDIDSVTMSVRRLFPATFCNLLKDKITDPNLKSDYLDICKLVLGMDLSYVRFNPPGICGQDYLNEFWSELIETYSSIINNQKIN